MKTVPKLVRVLNPPPITVSGNNLLNGPDLTTVVNKALRASLVQSHPLAAPPPPPTRSTTGAAIGAISAAAAPFKVLLINVHPCQPIITYLLVPTGPVGVGGVGGAVGGVGAGLLSSSTAAAAAAAAALLPKQIIVQHVHTRQILFRTSLGEVASHLYNDLDVLSKSAEARQAKMLKDLGMVQRLDFMDPSTLYWSGYVGGGSGSGGGTKTQKGGGESDEGSDEPSLPKRWFYLMVQFQNRIVILNLRQHGISLTNGGLGGVSIKASPTFVPILADITPASLGGAAISSNAVAVSQSTVIVACVDGTLKLYDWKAKIILQSILGQAWITTHNKNDYVVEIISTNPFSYTPAELYNNNNQLKDVSAAGVGVGGSVRQRAIVCLTKKGGAYLCPLVVTDHTVQDVATPIARMEGGAVPTSMSKQDDEHSSMDHVLVQYDGHRDLLLWLSPSKSKSRLLVWDLGALMAEERVRQLDAKNKRRLLADTALNRPDPTLILQFPLENVSHAIFPGWFHESVPKESMTCIAVTKDGDFQVFVSPLYNSGSTLKHPFQAVTVSRVNLLNVARRDLAIPEDSPNQPNFRVQSIHCPPLRDSSTFSVGTSIGVLQIRMTNLAPFPTGTHIAHLSANIGIMGKAILSVRGSQISYCPLDIGSTTGASIPLMGKLTPDGGPSGRDRDKATVVYESPPPLHLPPEIHKRPVRLPPLFLPSPSRNFLCCFWKEEMRYEILNVPTMLERVSSRNSNLMTGISPVVASGNGAASFAWVGDDDVYCLLYDPEQDLALKVGIDLSTAEVGFGKELADLTKVKELKKLKELARLKTYKKGVKSMVGTAGKLKSLEGLRDLGKDTGKLGIGAVKLIGKSGLGTVKLTGKVAMGVTQGAVKETTKVSAGVGKIGLGATKNVTKMAVGGTMKGANTVKKMATFGMWKKKSQDKKGEGSLANADRDDEDETPSTTTAPIEMMSEFDQEADEIAASEQLERKYPWVELRVLVGTSAGADGTLSGTTVSNLGQLTLRSGNRNPPTILFGGPVLCVGSKLDESDEGLAYFYTKKKGQDEESATAYVSSGPAFPCPDIVAWDDDGRLCAVVIQGRVSVYLSEEPNFVMLGTTRVGSVADTNAEVISCRFIHGVLYCTTRSSVQCIFLGDLNGGVCHLDSFILASVDVPTFPSKTVVTEYRSLTPPTIPMPLDYPEVLGYHSGSLILSTVSGIVALPLGFPLIRIGSLISAGSEHYPKAEKWFTAIPNCDHEILATFLERRGVPEMALQLPGVSLETIVDICMRFGYVDKLEETVEIYGLDSLRAIDMSRGVSANIFGPEEYGTSIVVCVGAYLLSYGRVELVRRLATECLASGEEGKRDALLLAGLLLSVNASDAKRVLQRSVDDVDEENWLVGSFVRNHILGHIAD